MAKKVFILNKLARDKMPNIMRNEGCTVQEKKLEGQELMVALKNKLIEEVNEIMHAKTNIELSEELADLIEVISSIATVNNTNLEEIEKIRIAKNNKRGGFLQGLFISTIEIDEENPTIKYYADKFAQ
jgi:predicted house-cleaning noncanonical NTP pyrophosphatase (MazG superfamily)